jgi:hypothetical protein
VDFNVDSLSDKAAARALTDVTQQWFAARGLQANRVLRQTEKYAERNAFALPAWATESNEGTPEAGKASRFALRLLLEDDDPEVRSWARHAVRQAQEVQAQVIDPLSIGLILGGLILASRVKKVGPDGIEFYEGIPPELAKVLKAGASFFTHVGGSHAP